MGENIYLTWDVIRDRLATYDNQGVMIYGLPLDGMLACSALKNARAVCHPAEANFVLDLVHNDARAAKYRDQYHKTYYSLFDNDGATYCGPWELEAKELEADPPEKSIIKYWDGARQMLADVAEDPMLHDCISAAYVAVTRDQKVVSNFIWDDVEGSHPFHLVGALEMLKREAMGQIED